MEEPSPHGPTSNAVTIRLSAQDIEILERFRGDLSVDAFVSALLRMIDSGAIQSTPDWAKKKAN